MTEMKNLGMKFHANDFYGVAAAGQITGPSTFPIQCCDTD